MLKGRPEVNVVVYKIPHNSTRMQVWVTAKRAINMSRDTLSGAYILL